ncbi:hypothetical protein PT109_01490 [Erysipelothrix rhusiopathiae]|nr:hypothetical protein [Erysipelothrix rhusiopathiae]MDE8180961.1 hypothetical protein [Erysipelothrix rhusiopathiae]
MKNIKKWLEPKKHKVIAGVSALLIVGLVIVGIYFATKIEQPTIVFKENIVVEYGQKSFNDDGELPIDENNKVEKLPILMPEDIIQKDKSKYEEISFNKIAAGGKPMTLEFRFIDTSEVGKHESVVYARLGNEVQEFKFSYEVKDTKKPIIDGDDEVTLEHGEEFDVKEYKAYDIIDGDLEITVDGMKDDVGTFDITLRATDKNNNTTEKIVKVTRKDAPVEEVNTSTDSGTTSNSSGNQSIGNNSSNAGNAGNGSSNNNGGSNAGVGNSNGGSGGGNNTGGGTKPTEPVKPSRPDPYTIAQEIGMTFHKDYGSFNGCSAVVDELTENNWKIWLNSYCDDNGYLFYTPKN